ncbi:response regulator [Alkalihalobacterium alkalinitrilicum]|uniref:response regulator n=1 Tax=Alkalihalobacterium alkalinitrilicum TaxID=427920 RepID=UPI000994F7D2|nr:response regulator [Alkalihalobacterium alkalinitrilicum]
MGRKPFIYLVEDEPAHAMLLTYHIEKLGYEVIHFENSVDFLDALPADLEFLIVSDQLADMAATKLCQIVRDKLNKPIRMIITSTGVTNQPCECSSFASFLQKPFSITDLKEKLNYTFQHHSLT